MDYQIEQWINSAAGAHPVWDRLMRGLATWAEIAFIALVALWFLWGWARGGPGDRQRAITALLAAGSALFVNQLITRVWLRPRPFVTHPVTVHLLLPRNGDPSFPSDHAAAAIAIAVVLIATHRRFGTLALLVAACIGYARVYVGVHYPGDVAGGAIIGLAVALAFLIWLDPLMEGLRRLVDRAIALLHLPAPA